MVLFSRAGRLKMVMMPVWFGSFLRGCSRGVLGELRLRGKSEDMDAAIVGELLGRSETGGEGDMCPVVPAECE